MKCLKTLGLATVAAMALMAFVGAGSASATVLCKTNLNEGCVSSGWYYPKGTSIRFALVPSTNVVFRNTSGEIEDSCLGVEGEPKKEIFDSTIEESTTNTGSATETVGGEVPVPDLLWAGCSAEITFNLQQGTLETHGISGTANATVTATGFRFTIKNASISCTYKTGAAIYFGELEGGKFPYLYINTVLQKEAGGFVCPSTIVLQGTYEVLGPTPIYVSKN